MTSEIDRKLIDAGYQVNHSHLSDEDRCHQSLAYVLDGPVVETAVAIDTIRDDPHWLPVAIDTKRQRIAWLKFADNLNQEAFFYQAVNRRLASGGVLDAFATSDSILHHTEILPDHPDPMGFIFHMSRCGSTLLGRAMASLADTQVVYEGPFCLSDLLFNSIDSAIDPGYFTHPAAGGFSLSAKDKLIVRNMINLCSRSPNEPTRYMIKCVGWNTLFTPLFLEVFPNSPGLFLYREPMGPMLSVLASRPRSWPIQGTKESDYVVGGDSRSLGYGEYHMRGFANFFRHALAQPKLAYVNYRYLNPESIQHVIKNGFGYCPDEAEMDLVKGMFSVHSKNNQRTKPYQGDQRIPPPQWLSAWLDEHLGQLYHALETSERNLFPPNR